MKGPFGEELFFKKDLSALELKNNESLIFFIDSKLKSKINKKITSNSPVKFLNGGENLKTLEQYQKNIKFLYSKKAHKKTKIVAIGGGSLLDSVAFLASTFLRGLDVILVPTTWLSCIDASVGGKTALNFGDKKNQIGSVYPPKSIYFCEKLIAEESLVAAEGEIVKTLFLNHNKAWAKSINKKVTFNQLKSFVEYKTKIVKSDPFEKNKKRMVLNLGHTLGHVVELSNDLSHGESVLYGLKFSLEWSHYKKIVKNKNYEKLRRFVSSKDLSSLKLKPFKLKKYLGYDKKSEGESLNFVFLSDKGPFVKKVKIDEIVDEYKRQLKSF